MILRAYRERRKWECKNVEEIGTEAGETKRVMERRTLLSREKGEG